MTDENTLDKHPTMLEVTANLFNNQFLSDIIFQIDDKSIYAHSHELSKRSKVFSGQYEATIGAMKLVVIKNRKYPIFFEFLKYIYTDICTITKSNAFELLKLALDYQIIGLVKLTMTFLTDHIAVDNVLKLYEFCLVENCATQMNLITNFISENMYVIIYSKQLLEINRDTLIALLNIDRIDNVTREMDFCNAMIRWVCNYCQKQDLPTSGQSHRAILLNALKNIRFPVMTSADFTEFIQNRCDLLTTEEINSIFISISLKTTNTLGFRSVPREVCINYSAGKEIVLNMKPYFGFESKLPLSVISSFMTTENIILSSVAIGVSDISQIIEVKLLNHAKDILRHKKISYDATKWKSGSVKEDFDLPYLLRSQQKYYLTIEYMYGSFMVKSIPENKLQKTHVLNNNKKVEIKFEELSACLHEMHFREVK